MRQRPERSRTEYTALFGVGRQAVIGNREMGCWRQHVDRERLASANLLVNTLASQGQLGPGVEEEMSF